MRSSKQIELKAVLSGAARPSCFGGTDLTLLRAGLEFPMDVKVC